MNTLCSKSFSVRGTMLLFLSAAMILLSGCGPREEISSYTFRKDKPGGPLAKKGQTQPVGSEEWQMVVGILQRNDDCWIFKIHGPKDSVAKAKEHYLKFFEGIGYVSADLPTFEVPDGFEMRAVSRMAAQMGGYANYRIPNVEPELLLKVSRLGGRQNLLENINRWRGQLGLESVGPPELKSQILETEYADGMLVVFNATGQGGGGMGGPMMRKMMEQGKFGQNAPNKKKSASKNPSTERKLGFELPEGWEEIKNAPVVALKIAKKSEPENISISVTEMPASFNDWNQSVSQWLSDLKMDLTEEQVAQQTSKISVASVEGQRIDLHPGGDAAQTESISGVMFEHGDKTWFVKMKGKTELVKSNADLFSQFLESLKIK